MISKKTTIGDSRTKKFGVGVDIGGTKIRSVLWDGKKVLAMREIKTPKTLNKFKNAISRLVENFTKSTWRFNRQIGIGVAVPGRIRKNTFVSATNIPFVRNVHFGDENIKIDHDARCFLRAELAARKNLKRKSVFGLPLGTGVGRAFAKNGKIQLIKKFEYPERWESKYQKIRDLKEDQALAKFLAKNLARLFKAYKPEIIIVGGGVAKRKNFVRMLAKEFHRSRINAKVLKSKFGQNAAAFGAAMLHKI